MDLEQFNDVSSPSLISASLSISLSFFYISQIHFLCFSVHFLEGITL